MKEQKNIIPCKDCLLLPACKNKKNEIRCSILRLWWLRLTNEHDQYDKDVTQLEKTLPNWNTFFWIRKG
jgi:hypothetical protein